VLTVKLFGTLQVEQDEQMLESLRTGKVQELFCYLLLYREHAHAREVLAGKLWPECPTAHSRKHLRQTLWRLQVALHSGLNLHNEVLTVSPGAVQLNGADAIWSDVFIFESAFRRAKTLAAKPMDSTDAQVLREAVQLYRGDLLEGWYHDWCLFERERLQNYYLLMLNQLLAYCCEHGDYQPGLEYGERVLRLDRAHELTHQQLMQLHYQCGNRMAALRQFERCAAALKEELDVLPSHTTLRFYEQIQLDRSGTPPASTPSAPADSRPGGVLRCLETLLGFISKIEDQITGIESEILKQMQALKAESGDSRIRRER
jgi:DNA-binding SARP family transcriptional activator